uniref:DNTTIP1_dimer domain-containing protein n=1 Tax=Angiostrongylus cantonensis TaxID=6313 RepID=A0A0K0CZH8_ANGCA
LRLVSTRHTQWKPHRKSFYDISIMIFQIFQNEITKELQQIMDRHIRTTFSPAIENLKNNGHVVDQDVINDLCTSILDAAKVPFMRDRAANVKRNRMNSERNKREYESDESDVSILSKSSDIKRRRGRPRKDEEPSSFDLSPFTLHEVLKWSPERHLLTTLYIPAAKVAAFLSIPVTVFFSKYPRMFRYSCDEEDRSLLMEEKKLSKGVGRCYLMIMDDVKELLVVLSFVFLYALLKYCWNISTEVLNESKIMKEGEFCNYLVYNFNDVEIFAKLRTTGVYGGERTRCCPVRGVTHSSQHHAGPSFRISLS